MSAILDQECFGMRPLARTGLVAILGVLLQTGVLMAQEWADLKVTFVYDSPTLPKNPAGAVADDRLLVDPTTKGIANVVFMIDVKKKELSEKDIYPDYVNVPKTSALISVLGQFAPRVCIVRAGQTLKLTNLDQRHHSFKFSFFENNVPSISLQPRSYKDIVAIHPEKAAAKIESPISPWMEGFILVLDHPYAAVSDEKGELTITNLPANKPLTFKIWHENQDKSIEKVMLNDQQETWKRGNVVLTLKPGMNDLGKVKIAPKSFRPLAP